MGQVPRKSTGSGDSARRSFRLSSRTLKLLDDRARALSVSPNSLAERLLDEGLRTEHHPLPEHHVRAAVDYCADFTNEVEQYRAEQREFERRERKRWERSQRLPE